MRFMKKILFIIVAVLSVALFPEEASAQELEVGKSVYVYNPEPETYYSFTFVPDISGRYYIHTPNEIYFGIAPPDRYVQFHDDGVEKGISDYLLAGMEYTYDTFISPTDLDADDWQMLTITIDLMYASDVEEPNSGNEQRKNDSENEEQSEDITHVDTIEYHVDTEYFYEDVSLSEDWNAEYCVEQEGTYYFIVWEATAPWEIKSDDTEDIIVREEFVENRYLAELSLKPGTTYRFYSNTDGLKNATFLLHKEHTDLQYTEGDATVKSHYFCAICGEFFLDENAGQPVERESLEITDNADLVGDNATISREDIMQKIENDEEVLLEFSVGTICFNGSMLEWLSEFTDDADLEVRLELCAEDVLSETQKDAISEQKALLILSADILCNGACIHEFGGERVLVQIPFTCEEGREYQVIYVAEDGTIEEIDTNCDEKYIEFSTKHFSTFIVVEKETETLHDDVVEVGGENTTLKYVLCFATMAFILVDVIIFIDLKKYIKLHGNELVENHRKGLMARGIAMTIISLLVGVIGIVLLFIP